MTNPTKPIPQIQKLLNHISKNPGMQGTKIPKQMRNHLAPSEKMGLTTYTSRKGWQLTQLGWGHVKGNDTRRMPASPKYFQGPGTSGHPTDCECAACRNFDD